MDTSILRPGAAGGNTLPFAALPHALVRDLRLTATDVRLAALLLEYARSKAAAWPSVATLADAIGRCRRTVQLALKRLREAGWVLSRPAANPTGRELVLAWREAPASASAVARCAGAQAPYSQGLPARPVAPQGRRLRREGEVAPPAPRQKPRTPPAEAPDPATLAPLLCRPARDPLRRMAERLASGLGRPPSMR